MKTACALSLAAALAVGLAGCGGGNRDNTGYNTGAYNNGTYNNGAYDNGTYDNGAYNNGAYDNNAYDSGSAYNYRDGAYDGGSMLDDAGDALRNGVNDVRDALR